jgi:hypothetical protein
MNANAESTVPLLSPKPFRLSTTKQRTLYSHNSANTSTSRIEDDTREMRAKLRKPAYQPELKAYYHPHEYLNNKIGC